MPPAAVAGGYYSKPYTLIFKREGVNTVKKQEMPEVKRVNINIPVELHNSFKAAAAARGENMTDVLLKDIEEYVRKYGTVPARKGRRA
jgi:hypothetical protein